jgi:putative iron-dependent peroxidase
VNGGQRQIVRDNMPFGSPGRGEFGTYFIGYAADPAVTEQMLENMFLGRPPGNYDRILDFSTAVTGGLFFAPPAGFLEQPPEPPSGRAAAERSPAVLAGVDVPGGTAAAHGAVVPDGSLGIGSLNRSARS